MKKLSTLLLLLIPLVFACSGSDSDADVTTKDGPFKISELAGNWTATKAQFSVSSTSIDLIEVGGTALMTVQTSGRFTLTLDAPDRPAYTVSGEMFWEQWQGTYYFAITWDDDPGDWDTYGHTYDGTTLSLNGGADTGEFDFNNDGEPESCSIHFVFTRT